MQSAALAEVPAKELFDLADLFKGSLFMSERTPCKNIPTEMSVKLYLNVNTETAQGKALLAFLSDVSGWISS